MSEYPTSYQLRKVRKWKFMERSDCEAFMAYIKAIGKHWPDNSFGWKQRGRTYWVSTGGWSGNEDILEAMQSNRLFWVVCWMNTRRGGHYTFRLPNS